MSGFAVNEEHGQVDDESGGGCVSAIFESALQATHPGIYAAASKHIIDDVRAASIKQVKSGTPDKPANLWQQLRDTSASANGNEVGFSFDFGLV